LIGPRRRIDPTTRPREQAARPLRPEALKTPNASGDGTLLLWPGAATHFANSQRLGMAVLYLRLIGAHGLSPPFTLDAGYNPLAVSAFMLYEAQRPSSAAAFSGRLERFVGRRCVVPDMGSRQ